MSAEADQKVGPYRQYYTISRDPDGTEWQNFDDGHREIFNRKLMEQIWPEFKNVPSTANNPLCKSERHNWICQKPKGHTGKHDWEV